MRRLIVAGVGTAALLALAGCGKSHPGVFARSGPDEFAISRQQPLVIPPDYALTPPRPGAPRPQEADSSAQTLQAMFGGPAQVSSTEADIVDKAGGARSDPGVRPAAGDPDTDVVDKGAATRTIVAAPEGDGAEAKASTTAH